MATYAANKTTIDAVLNSLVSAGVTLDAELVRAIVAHYTPEDDVDFLEIARTMPATFWDRRLRNPIEERYEERLTALIVSERNL